MGVSNRRELIKQHLSGAGFERKRQNNIEGDEYSDYSSNTADYSSNTASQDIDDSDCDGEAKNKRDLLQLADFIREEFLNEDDKTEDVGVNPERGKESKACKEISLINTLDISTSDTPLHDFSVKQLEYSMESKNFEREDKIRSDDAESFQMLLDMYESEV